MRGVDGMRCLNLGDLAVDLVNEIVRRVPERTADVSASIESDEILVAGSATLLGAGVRNLLSNAVKFTRAGDAVRVRVAREADAGVLVVEDAGPGIGAAERGRVFDPFFRGGEARASHDGFGLGLPILKRIALVHGGDVAVSRSLLGGARFELRLPLWQASQAAKDDDAAGAPRRA